MNHIGFEIGHPQTERLGPGWLCFSTAVRKPNATEDGSPGINDPDGAIQEYGIREYRRKQDSFLKNGTEKRKHTYIKTIQ